MTTFIVSRLRTAGLVAAVLALSSLSAQAAELTASGQTREQVRAEYQRALAADELASPADLYAPVRQALVQSQRSARVATATREAQPTVAAVAAQRQASAAR